jgi:hypothetical protein
MPLNRRTRFLQSLCLGSQLVHVPETQDLDIYFSRLKIYAPHVKGVQFSLRRTTNKSHLPEQLLCLNLFLEYTTSRPLFPKLKLLAVTESRYRHDDYLVGVHWLGLFLSPSLAMLKFSIGPVAGPMAGPVAGPEHGSHYCSAALKELIHAMASRCPALRAMDLLLSPFVSIGIGWIAHMTQLRSLRISGIHSAENQHLLSELALVALPTLKSLEVTSRVLEPLLALWCKPIVNHLHIASIHLNYLGDKDIAVLFTLIVAHSPHIKHLTVPVSPDCFSRSLLHMLRPLPLRSLTLEYSREELPETHPDILQYIGSIWPMLEYFSSPFVVNYASLLEVSIYLPHLRHLVAILPTEPPVIPTRPMVESWPGHDLFLWVDSTLDLRSASVDPDNLAQCVNH